MNPEKEYQEWNAAWKANTPRAETLPTISTILGKSRAPSGFDYTAHDRRIEEILHGAGFGRIVEAKAEALEEAAEAAQADELSTAREVISDLRTRAKELRKQGA